MSFDVPRFGTEENSNEKKTQKNTIKLDIGGDLGKLWVIKDVYTGLGSGCFNRHENLNGKILVIRLVQEIIKICKSFWTSCVHAFVWAVKNQIQ